MGYRVERDSRNSLTKRESNADVLKSPEILKLDICNPLYNLKEKIMLDILQSVPRNVH
jgi:phage FluMu gp28-like protein